jgi:hypothetical protein
VFIEPVFIEPVFIEPGRICLDEDLTGKGHTFRGLGREDWVALFLDFTPRTRGADNAASFASSMNETFPSNRRGNQADESSSSCDVFNSSTAAQLLEQAAPRRLRSDG